MYSCDAHKRSIVLDDVGAVRLDTSLCIEGTMMHNDTIRCIMMHHDIQPVTNCFCNYLWAFFIARNIW